MSCLWSFCLFVVLTVSVYGSFYDEELEQGPPKSILKSLKPDFQKKVTFEESTPLESKPLSQKYAKKAAYLKKCQEKRNSQLTFEQLLTKKVNLDIKNFELQEEIKGSLTLSQQKDLLALRMQSLIFQQKKLETFVSKQKKDPSLKEEKMSLKKKKSPKKTTSSGQGTSRTGSLYARCDDDSSGSSTEEMLLIPQEEELVEIVIKIETETETKKTDLKRGASCLNLEGGATLPNKRPRLKHSKNKIHCPEEDESFFADQETEDLDFSSVNNYHRPALNNSDMDALFLAPEEKHQEDRQSPVLGQRFKRSSSFLVALPQDEKPFLMGQSYEEIAGIPSNGDSLKTQRHIPSPKKMMKRKSQVRSQKESSFVQESAEMPKMRRSPFFLVALPQDEKPYITGAPYEAIRGLPSRSRGEPVVEFQGSAKTKKKELKKKDDSVKKKGFPTRSASFRLTTPDEIKDFLNKKNLS